MITRLQTVVFSSMFALTLSWVTGCAGPADLEVERPDPVTHPDEALIDGINRAGLRIYHEAARTTDHDVALSPLSVGVAWGMLDVGAAGDVAAELEDLFGWPSRGEGRWSLFHSLLEGVTGEHSVTDGDADPVTLDLANRVYVDTEFTPGDQFAAALPRWFDASVEELDFLRNPDAARRHINAWVAERTNDLIPELIPPDRVTKDTVVALINTLYFKGEWASQFDAAMTLDDDFTLLDGTTVTVDMMRQPQWHTRATQGDSYVAVELPYANSDISMLVIVPDAGAFRRVEERLSVSLLSRIDAESEAMTVALSMPRFETSTSLDLKEIIRDGLGYQNIFDTMQLPGIGVKTAVTEAFHQVKVIVDEQGTEAAAATYIGVIALSAPPAADLSVRVDRPFLYVIRDTSTGVILFVGKVLNPAS